MRAPVNKGAAAAPHLERGRLRWLWAAALFWLAALGLLVALFTFAGETSWPMVLLLYLPRHPWALPALVLLPCALRRGRRALLWPLALGVLVWLFPIMGFVLPRPRSRPADPSIRVLSYNTTHTRDGVEGLRELVAQTRPDLVLFQWTTYLANEALSGPGFEGWAVQRAEQFTVATRFPILSLETGGIPSGSGSPCLHVVLDTPLGMLDVYSIRPLSARFEIGAAHGRGLRQRFLEFVEDANSGRLAKLTSFREAQTRSIAEMVARARHPVLIAGDTNLPEGSRFLRRYFSGFKDAFVESSWGFGFTHPAKLPWLRLDRVLLGRGLGAKSFHVLPRRAAAHRPVVADVIRTPS